ncbi:sensor histidine kinase [Kitasatospora purpeofusca]|uniref:sensor histidine kinase n=1 Tax=Kitasatospora purpeofusca TaxID=67352 RepID=UPI0035DDBEF2
MRLALLHGLLFLTVGVLLLALNWVTVRHAITEHSDLVMPTTELLPALPGPATGPFEAPAQPAAATTPARFTDFRSSVLTELLLQSALILAGLTVLSAALGWWTAGRYLARLGAVTAAARRIGERNLHDRLALTGPRDEITELADTFDHMLDRLERAFAAQRQFTAHASHELRTPLTLQRTALEVPLAQGRVPADLAPAVHRALAANARSEALLAALLALAQGESGSLDPRPTDLADLAAEAAAAIGAEAESAGLTLTTRLDPAPTTGDPALLARLTTNLLANAARYNHPGGRISVTTGHDTGPGHGTDSAHAWLRVRNTGPVVAPELLPALFEPFRRGDPTGPRGSGLGLAVVRSVTEAHRGHIEATALPTGGLDLLIALPAPQ